MELNKIINSRVITIDSFHFIYNQYHYTSSYNDDGWSVIRREVNKPNIPPCMQILTNKGWVGVTSDWSAHVRYQTVEEVVDMTWLKEIPMTVDKRVRM